MGVLNGRLRALYGGRHGRTTAVLATASAVAGALTGFVGIGIAGEPASHNSPAPTPHVKATKPRHHASTAPAITHVRPTHSHSPSPSATRTTVKPTPSATPTVSSSPSAPASSPPPSDPPSAPPSASPPA